MLVVAFAFAAFAPAVYAQSGNTKPKSGATRPIPPPSVKPQPPTTTVPAPTSGTGAKPTTGTQTPASTPAVPTGMATPSSMAPSATAPGAAAPALGVPVATANDYVIGPGDILAVVFWRQDDMSAEVIVRPDGKISVPLLNEVDVTGLTPEQLRMKLTSEALRFIQDPNVTVVVKQINSRRVFVTGQVVRPGPYPLISSVNVLQLLSMAGGLLEYADAKKILIMRTINGKTTTFKFNYKEMIDGKNPKQNIELRPDDTVIVP
jgi:polysaccharide export outer membrane protein